jgi:hypothetical protein
MTLTLTRPASAADNSRAGVVRARPRFGVTAVLMLCGAMPVTAIPLSVLGWLPMRTAALACVLPLALVAVALIVRRTPEGCWARDGAVAGLVAVGAYDAVRMPLVAAGIWPDFIPRIGGWLTGEPSNPALGYTWRYLGDGAGIALAYFAFCGMVLAIRPRLVTARPVLVSVGYGVFVWTGLLATVVLPAHGEQLLFRLTPASFALSLLGHLIYGAVLGLFLRRRLRRMTAVAT